MLERPPRAAWPGCRGGRAGAGRRGPPWGRGRGTPASPSPRRLEAHRPLRVAELAGRRLRLAPRPVRGPGRRAHPDLVEQLVALALVVGALDGLRSADEHGRALRLEERSLVSARPEDLVRRLREDAVDALARADLEHGGAELGVGARREPCGRRRVEPPDRARFMSQPTSRTSRSPFALSARRSAAAPGAPAAVTRTVSRLTRRGYPVASGPCPRGIIPVSAATQVQRASSRALGRVTPCAAHARSSGRSSARCPDATGGTSILIGTGRRSAFLGTPWGMLQFDFLVAQGLKPEHYLLDVGCGPLRAGVHFMAYLEAGHYFGVEKRADLLEAGRDVEIPRSGARRQEADARRHGGLRLRAAGPDLRLRDRPVRLHAPPPQQHHQVPHAHGRGAGSRAGGSSRASGRTSRGSATSSRSSSVRTSSRTSTAIRSTTTTRRSSGCARNGPRSRVRRRVE